MSRSYISSNLRVCMAVAGQLYVLLVHTGNFTDTFNSGSFLPTYTLQSKYETVGKAITSWVRHTLRYICVLLGVIELKNL
jgi:hypothetical protein